MFAGTWAFSAEPLRVGVLLSLTGPIATEARPALDEIGGILKRDRLIDLSVQDDQSNIALAVEGTHKLLSQRVDIVIGPISSAATAAIAPIASARGVLVVSLAGPSRSRLAAIRERNQAVIMFAPLSDRYIEATGKLIRNVGNGRVSFAYFHPAATEYVDEIVPMLGKYGGRFETLAKAPVGTVADVQRFSSYLMSKSRSLVVGTVLEATADAMTGKGVWMADTPMVLFSPPSVREKARIAATLIVEAAKKGARKRDQVLTEIQRNPIYGKASGTLQVDWTVTGFNIDKHRILAFGGGLDGVTPCTCSSKNGKVTKLKNCRNHTEQCVLGTIQEDTCEIECRARH